MNDNVVNLAAVVRLIRHRWSLLVVLAVLGAVLGAGASLLLSPGYASTSKVIVQGRDKSTMPGEAQIATSLVVLDRAATALNAGISGEDLQAVVTAAALDGNVLEIRATAAAPEQAQQIVDHVTQEYVTFSTQIVNDAAAAFAEASQRSRDAIQKRIDDAKQQVATLQAAPALNGNDAAGAAARDDLDRARSAEDGATKDLAAFDERKQSSDLDSSLTQASMRIIEPAVLPGDPASPSFTGMVVGGALLLPLLGLFAHLLGWRTDRRLRRIPEIATALGAPVLGDVEVIGHAPGGWLSFVHDDRRWAVANSPVADDDRSRASRYHRILSRVRSGRGPLRLMVLIPHDDQNVRTAVVDMAIATAAGGETVSVITEDDGVATAVRDGADRHEVGGRLAIGDEADHANVLMRVVVIAAARPSVPDTGPETVMLLALTAGTRAGWELVEIAGACSEAGRPLSGALLAVPRFEARTHGSKPAPDAEAEPVTTTVGSS